MGQSTTATVLVDRVLSTGKHLRVQIEGREIVARVDGVVIAPDGLPSGWIMPVSRMDPGLGRQVAAKGGVGIMQGNIMLFPGEIQIIVAAREAIERDNRARLEAAVPGLVEWEQAHLEYEAARVFVDDAGQPGSPEDRAVRLQTAREALDAVYAKHPKTRAWASICEMPIKHQLRFLAVKRAWDAVHEGADPVVEARRLKSALAALD